MFLLSAPFHILYSSVSYPSLIGLIHLLPLSICLIPSKTHINFMYIKFWGTKHSYYKYMSPNTLHKGSDLGFNKNYISISLNTEAVKLYNAMLRSHRKNQNGFRRNRSSTSRILTIHRIIEELWAKSLEATFRFFKRILFQHHHVVLLVRIYLTLLHHPSLPGGLPGCILYWH